MFPNLTLCYLFKKIMNHIVLIVKKEWEENVQISGDKDKESKYNWKEKIKKEQKDERKKERKKERSKES